MWAYINKMVSIMIRVKQLFGSIKATTAVREFIGTNRAYRRLCEKEKEEEKNKRDVARGLESGRMKGEKEEHSKEARARNRSGETEIEEERGYKENGYVAEEEPTRTVNNA